MIALRGNFQFVKINSNKIIPIDLQHMILIIFVDFDMIIQIFKFDLGI